MAEAYRAETSALVCDCTLSQLWEQFKEERSVSLCPTSLTSDYKQVGKWLARCPIQEPAQGRRVLTWVLQQKPEKSARRVCMYVRSMYLGLCRGRGTAAPQPGGQLQDAQGTTGRPRGSGYPAR